MKLYEKIKEGIQDVSEQFTELSEFDNIPFVSRLNDWDETAFVVVVNELPETYAEWQDELSTIKGDLLLSMIIYTADGDVKGDEEIFNESKEAFLLVQIP
jgi:hypothetical protein